MRGDRRKERVRTASRLISGVFYDNIRFVVLEITEREEDDIALVDPDLKAGREGLRLLHTRA